MSVANQINENLKSGVAQMPARLIRFVKVALFSYALHLSVASANPREAYVDPQKCEGSCSVFLFAGPVLDAGRTALLVPAWDWDVSDSGIFGGTLGYRLLTYGKLWSLEVELGLAKRFGELEATEVWGATYLRWLYFPWNHLVNTTVAVSTGLSYATKIEEFERSLDNNGNGSKLLHYLSPEITFAHPKAASHELVVRLHHRSGGRNVIGPIDAFNDAGAGIDALLVDYRQRF